MSDVLWPHELYAPRLLCPWDFPGKNTGVGCHLLLQGNFVTQGSNAGLLLESPGKPSLLFNSPQRRSQVKPSCFLRLSQSYWRTVSGPWDSRMASLETSCGPWGRKESDTTEGLNWTELNKSAREATVTKIPQHTNSNKNTSTYNQSNETELQLSHI